MADNYLEKKMDDYRYGKTVSPLRRQNSNLKPGQIIVSHPRTAIFIAAETFTPVVEGVVRQLCRFGHKVNLSGLSQQEKFRRLSWDSGCTYNPALPARALSDAENQRGKIDAVVVVGRLPDFNPDGYKIIAVDGEVKSAFATVNGIDDPDTVGAAIVFLTQAIRCEVSLAIVGNSKKL